MHLCLGPAQLPSVLRVVYLVFTEGYAASSGDDLLRPDLADEAMRLAPILDRLLHGEREVTGLLALLLTDAGARQGSTRRGPGAARRPGPRALDADLIAGEQISGDGAVSSHLAAVSRIPANMEVFSCSRSPEGGIDTHYGYEGDRWRLRRIAPVDTAFITTPLAALLRVPGHMEVWWDSRPRSLDGAYWYGQDWTRYQLSPGPMSIGLAAVSHKLEHMEVMWVGEDGAVNTVYWYGP
ncbi:DUF6596 domain-containing protein [Streptomyces cinnamoneus]|uniref:DUF6596 domain-containing protein n=1 Tax=Streptomyces cinnamoneus TaxID=53446 RepID=UPI003571350D